LVGLGRAQTKHTLSLGSSHEGTLHVPKNRSLEGGKNPKEKYTDNKGPNTNYQKVQIRTYLSSAQHPSQSSSLDLITCTQTQQNQWLLLNVGFT
jgi:hypothetical protein